MEFSGINDRFFESVNWFVMTKCIVLLELKSLIKVLLTGKLILFVSERKGLNVSNTEDSEFAEQNAECS